MPIFSISFFLLKCPFFFLAVSEVKCKPSENLLDLLCLKGKIIKMCWINYQLLVKVFAQLLFGVPYFGPEQVQKAPWTEMWNFWKRSRSPCCASRVTDYYENTLDKLLSSCKTLFAQLFILNLVQVPFEVSIFLLGRFQNWNVNILKTLLICFASAWGQDYENALDKLVRSSESVFAQLVWPCVALRKAGRPLVV